MGKVRSAQSAGSIVRRVREEKGVSRAELSSETGIGTRTIYALEQGEGKNFGLENYLKILAALGLDMSVDLKGSPAAIKQPDDLEAPLVPTFELADIWKLDGCGEIMTVSLRGCSSFRVHSRRSRARISNQNSRQFETTPLPHGSMPEKRKADGPLLAARK